MAVRILAAVQRLPGSPTAAESRPSKIGPISLGVKQTGERSAGNLHAAFDEAGAGNVARSRWCDTRRRKGETTGNTNFDLNRRASPRPYLGAPGGEIPPGDSTLVVSARSGLMILCAASFLIDKVRERASDFDILHFHIDLFHFPLFRSLEARTLTTLHGRQDLSDLKPFYYRFSKMPLVSISAAQRRPLPHANFVATIHHGIPADLHRPAFERGSYLAFLGRISPEKRPDRAIRIAQRIGIPLKIAAKVDNVDEAYFRTEILPLVDGKGVEFLGEINEREKTTFLGDAAALLFPIDWPEPFGLVMIEAMACGTPVLAFRRGSVSEVVEDGITGKVVESEDEAVAKLPEILSYDRRTVRQRFQERFTATRMAKDYVRAYRKLLKMHTVIGEECMSWQRLPDLNRNEAAITPDN